MQTFKESFSQHYFILSLLFVMAVYLPVNGLKILNFDDTELVMRLHNNFSDINWVGLFFRDSSTKYYRPLLEVLCYLDYAMWGLSITAYHLTNYIIHIFNACLVYLIARQWFQDKKNAGIWAALAMVFFALNPLTCESVAWISGRSDLAGTFFSLLAVYCWFLKSSLRFFLTPLAILSGLLCKENALAVIPIIVLLEWFINYRNKKSFNENLKSCFAWSIIVLIPLFLYLFLRTNGWENHTYEYINVTKSSPAASQGVTGKIDILKILYLLPVTAFYLKKLIIPFPLNFAIADINTGFYAFLSAVIFGLIIVWLKKKKVSYIFFLCLLVLSFVPALPVALENISWVPMAERYLYMSVSIMAIGAASLLLNFQEKKIFDSNLLITICLIIILILSVATFQREFVFKDSKSIWTATLKTNPDNGMVLQKYAQAVGLEEGQKAYRKAVANPEPFVWRAEALLGIAQYESSIGNHDSALQYILQ
ncbi:MAG: hypothetical protein ABFS35_24275, partial [Bacteroidota bacterium]